jgi:hypothetical protein
MDVSGITVSLILPFIYLSNVKPIKHFVIIKISTSVSNKKP